MNTRNITSARALFDQTKKEEGLMHLQEFREMVKEKKQEQFNSNSLDVAQESLEVTKKSYKLNVLIAVFTLATLLISLYSLLMK